MARKRQSIESGFESDDHIDDLIPSTAMRDFYRSYMPQLELAVRRSFPDNEDHCDAYDPTIDLEKDIDKVKAIEPPSPIQKNGHQQRKKDTQIVDHKELKPVNSTFTVNGKKDPTLEELECLVDQIKRRNHYTDKLIDIMLKGLEKTLSPEIYRIFIQAQLPVNWLPLVRINNDNTPYVEFLIKSDVADQDPDSQLSDYTMKHIAYSQFVVDFMRESTKRLNVVPGNNQRSSLMGQNKQQQLQLLASHKRSHDKPPAMSCSTPIPQKKAPRGDPPVKSSEPPKDDLNDSKRILPSRACKASFTGSYKVS